MFKKITKTILPLLLGLAVLGPLFLSKGTANASNPATINFQGKIVNASDGTNIASPNGTYSIVFRIYNTSSPTMTTSCTTTSSCLWQETQSSVTLTNGIFQVELGSSCALTSSSCNNSAGGPINFANSNSLYLTMQFNGDTSGSNGGFMSPLIHITSVPFALQADNSSTLGGLAAGNFVQLAQGVQNDSSTTNSSIFINKTNASGSPNLLQLQKSNSDVFVVGNTGATTITNTSSSAFKVQGAASVLAIDTTNSLTNVQGINSVATFGSELATSPSCSGTGWSGTGAGPYTHSSGTTALSCSPPASLTNGATYQIVFTVGGSPTPGTTVKPTAGGVNGQYIGANVTNETQLIPTGGSAGVTFIPSTSFNGTVTIVSVKQLTQTANPVISVNNSDGTVGVEIRAGGSSLINTFIGQNSGLANTTGSYNTALGASALSSNISGQYNGAIGNNALAVNTTGSYNNAFGDNALVSNTTGSYNQAFGESALFSNSTGTNNSAFGNSALASNTTGIYNVAFGNNALEFNDVGSGNIAVGGGALISNSGGENVAIGDSAGSSNQTGSNNVFIGANAGLEDPNTPSFSTLGNLQNATAIGYGSQVQENNAIVLGAVGATSSNLTPNVGIGTTSPTNLFSVSPDIYDTGTASVTSGTTAVTESGATWSSNFAGMEIIFADGTKYTIASATSSTITLSSNATATETNSAYRIHNPAFYVSSTGSAGIRTSTDSTKGFTVQNAAGDYLLNVDTSNPNITLATTGTTGTAGHVELDVNPNGVYAFANGASYAQLVEQDADNYALKVLSFAATTEAVNINAQSNGGGINISNNGTGTSFLVNGLSTSTGLDIQHSGVSGLRVNSSNQVLLGQANTGGSDGTLVFNTSAGTHTVGLSLQADPASSYTLLLPTGTVSSNQCLQSGTVSGGNVPLTFASCSGSGGGDNGFVNSVAVTDFNLQDVAASTSVTGTTWTASGSNPTNVTLAISDASATTKGSVTTGSQTFAGVKTFQDFVVLQPAASMTAGQTALTQTLTNASSTGGIVNGYSQTITVSNTTSASTTNGFNISLTDNTSLANTNNGIKISLAGTNTSQTQIGVNVSVNNGLGISAVATGTGSASLSCNGFSLISGTGVCGGSNGVGGNGVVGVTSVTDNSNGIGNAFGTGLFGINTKTNTTSSDSVFGVQGITTGSSNAGSSIGVVGKANGAAGSKIYGGYFTLGTGGATAGAALYASNSTVAANILDLQDNTTSVFTVGDNGLISLQPAAALTGTGTQSNISQTLTNNQTGGTVNGYNQSITVSNASGTTTTNGFNIGIVDNASSLANTNKGITVSITGSNNSRNDIGIDVGGTIKGIGVRAVVTSESGTLACANSSGNVGIALCGDSTDVNGTGVYGRSTGSNGFGSYQGVGVFGTNTATGTASSGYSGLSGISLQSGAANYNTAGVYGRASGGAGASVYGGYFKLDSSSTATAGAALYATNSTVASNILNLQDNTTDVLTVRDGGLIGVQNTISSMTVPSGLTGTASAGGSLTASSTYKYYVTAIDSLGGETTKSNEFSCADANANCASGGGGGQTISLTWTAVTGASGYKVYRTAAGGASNSELYCTTVIANSYKDTGAVATCAGAFPSTNTAVVSANNSNSLGQITVGGLGTPTGQVYVGGIKPLDVTNGGVKASGNTESVFVQGSYAYVLAVNGTTCKLQIFDVSNPAAPVDVSGGGVSTGASSNPSGIYVQGHYAYITLEATGKLIIFDVSNPAAPVDVSGGGVSTGLTPFEVYVQGRYAYITDVNSNKFQIFDVSNPAAPVDVSGGGAVTGTNPFPVYVQGRYAYVGADSDSKLQIFDVSNPAAPVDVSGGGVSTAGGVQSIFVQGRYAYLLAEGNSKFQIFDVSNPAAPVDVSGGGVSTGASSEPWSIYVQGRYAYIVSNTNPGKLIVFDVSNPAAPVDVTAGGVSTITNPDRIFVQGRYAYVVSQSSAKLQIFDLGGEYSQQLEAGGAKFGTLNVSSNSNLAGDLGVGGGGTIGQNLQVGGNIGAAGSFYIQGGSVLGGNKNRIGAPTGLTANTATSGGSLSGVYKYEVTAVDAYGGETTVSNEVTTASLGSPNQTEPLTWTAVAGASGYKVYRTAAGGGSGTETSLALTSTNSYTDTGAILPLAAVAPTTDTTGQLTVLGSGLVKTTSNITTAFQVQNSSGVSIFTVDSTNGLVALGNSSLAGQLSIYNGSNAVSLKAASSTASYNIILPASAGATNQCLVNTSTPGTLQWLPCGAGSTASVTLVPEFVGAVLTGDGSNNTGTMTSDFCSGSSALNINSSICDGATTKQHNYYNWTATAQADYDIWIRWQVPSDFSSWAASNPISWFSRESNNGTNNDVKMNIFTNTGSTCGTGTSMTSTTGSWQTTNYSNSGCSPAAGDILVIDIHMSVAASGNTCQMGEITMTYNRN